MKKYLYLIVLVNLTIFGCKPEVVEPPIPEDPRGNIKTSELLYSYSETQVDSIIQSLGQPLVSNLFSVDHPIDVYKIVYETIDAKGEPTIASGAFVVPGGIADPITMTSYQHGTVVLREDVPSASGQELLVGIIFATDRGVAVSMPDYLGLGDSPGMHPYIHAKSEATACVDMLRASKLKAEEIGLALNEKLLLFGYSQGGHATMALHREIQEEHSDEFTVTASAPSAGPYDVSGYQANFISGDDPYDAPFYLPYVALSYNDVYDLYSTPSEFFDAPFDMTIPPLFDGLNSNFAIDNAMMTNIPSEIIKPDVLEAFRFNYDHPLRIALRDNDLYDWKPEAPVKLCHCTTDNLVAYENSLVAYNTFLAKGVTNVAINSPGNFDHGECSFFCFLDSFLFFDDFL